MIRDKIFVSIVIIFAITKSSTSIHCHKCYRVEDCPRDNCTSFYGLLDTTYREHFFIEKDHTLPLCPTNFTDESSWQKLELDGDCSRGIRNQPCAISRFEISGVSTTQNVLHGIFLGCPKETLVEPVLKPVPGKIKPTTRCITRRTETVAYEPGVVEGRPHRYIDLRMANTLCSFNCSTTPWKCDLCFTDGCINPNNTKIIKVGDVDYTDMAINWALLLMAVIVVLTFVLAAFCGMERIGRLDLIMSEEGIIYQQLKSVGPRIPNNENGDNENRDL